MLTSIDQYTSVQSVFDVQLVWTLVTSITYFCLVFDWIAHITTEYRLLWKGQTLSRLWSLSSFFLVSRYTTLFWATFVFATWGNVHNRPSTCAWSKYYPYGFTVVMLFAHLVIVTRIYAIYSRSKMVLGIMLAMTVADFAIQMGVNHLATAVLLEQSNPYRAVCFTLPTKTVFCLVFVSSTVYHHLLLLMTLYQTMNPLRQAKKMSMGTIISVIQRDHILYVLAICLTNFANLVLVLQPSPWPYKLINQLPAACFTQIFLSRIVFHLKITARGGVLSNSNQASGSNNTGSGSGGGSGSEKVSNLSGDGGHGHHPYQHARYTSTASSGGTSNAHSGVTAVNPSHRSQLSKDTFATTTSSPILKSYGLNEKRFGQAEMRTGQPPFDIHIRQQSQGQGRGHVPTRSVPAVPESVEERKGSSEFEDRQPQKDSVDNAGMDEQEYGIAYSTDDLEAQAIKRFTLPHKD